MKKNIATGFALGLCIAFLFTLVTLTGGCSAQEQAEFQKQVDTFQSKVQSQKSSMVALSQEYTKEAVKRAAAGDDEGAKKYTEWAAQAQAFSDRYSEIDSKINQAKSSDGSIKPEDGVGVLITSLVAGPVGGLLAGIAGLAIGEVRRRGGFDALKKVVAGIDAAAESDPMLASALKKNETLLDAVYGEKTKELVKKNSKRAKKKAT